MERWKQPLRLLWLSAVVAINILGTSQASYQAVEDDKLQQILINKPLQGIPLNANSSSVTKLVIEGSSITLNDADRLALDSYPGLVELHLDGNLVTSIPATYFSVVPQLRVLSLSRNKISSLDPESFSGLDVLTELDLSHNLLTSIHTQLFRRLSNLQVLNLQENPWNCSCLLLSSIGEVKTGLTVTCSTGGPQVTCASLESQAGKDLLQATAVCHPSPPTAFTTEPQKPPTPVNFQQSWGSSTKLNSTTTSTYHINKGRTKRAQLDKTPVLGNTWKFTACIAGLALCTFTLIICAIKGPSWYKLFHNYRHQRLHQEEDEEETVVSTVFADTGRYLDHQTFTFEQENGRIEVAEDEEEEDGYFEDPYIKREE
ncbi:uncharacterized protein LOC143339752 [Chaetodon auriga]|uniref:uncharacterized protein LOC143339752 n=1 Tax=Chaetodon auriga TaxID=39042 RepID=UPI004032C884